MRESETEHWHADEVEEDGVIGAAADAGVGERLIRRARVAELT